ncbi:hypothetical protein I316_01177 [Kwoniella heveanensis BCC8398]|uniref:Uncharacterized protein n=1 Tax=Kwoniella heveanensis BCC8398 TaxID=1296120 RepID=A0A1B9H1W1_9TREE|nr:hypothetical protein I316_01177 [Kwoniella heveanensis BCC8398]
MDERFLSPTSDPGSTSPRSTGPPTQGERRRSLSSFLKRLRKSDQIDTAPTAQSTTPTAPNTITIADATVTANTADEDICGGRPRFTYRGTAIPPTASSKAKSRSSKQEKFSRDYCKEFCDDYVNQLDLMSSGVEDDDDNAPRDLSEAKSRYERFIRALDEITQKHGVRVQGTVSAITDPSSQGPVA